MLLLNTFFDEHKRVLGIFLYFFSKTNQTVESGIKLL